MLSLLVKLGETEARRPKGLSRSFLTSHPLKSVLLRSLPNKLSWQRRAVQPKR